MKNSIILPSEFETIFMIEARKGGYIKHIDIGRDFSQIDGWEERANAKKFRTKQKLFQMLLLYDELILPDADPTYEYEKLQEKGRIIVYPVDDYLRYEPWKEEEHLAYAEYLKPAILPLVIKRIKNGIYMDVGDLKLNDIISNIYDYVLDIECSMDEEVLKIIDKNESMYKKRHNEETNRLMELNAPKFMLEKRFFSNIEGIIKNEYRMLCWELEMCSQKDAYIINSEYDLSKIGCKEIEKDMTSTLAVYKILQCECSALIGALPKMNSLEDVFNLKKSRKNDIKNLKQELENLENIIKTEGKEQAIKKAAEDVKRASNALAKCNTMEKIETWTTGLSVPAGVADLICGMPISMGVSVLGTGGLIAEKLIKGKYGWCEIVR